MYYRFLSKFNPNYSIIKQVGNSLLNLLFQELKRYLQQTLNKVEDLYTILISDLDGVVILKGLYLVFVNIQINIFFQF